MSEDYEIKDADGDVCTVHTYTSNGRTCARVHFRVRNCGVRMHFTPDQADALADELKRRAAAIREASVLRFKGLAVGEYFSWADLPDVVFVKCMGGGAAYVSGRCAGDWCVPDANRPVVLIKATFTPEVPA